MAYNGGRRAPNVSQYINNLNLPADYSAQNEFAAFDDGLLDSLVNTEFLDFDNLDGGFSEQPAPSGPQQLPQQMPIQPQPQQKPAMGMNGPGYQFGEFQTYPSLASSPTNLAPQQNLQGAYQVPAHQQSFQAAPINVGDKRKASAADLEEASRVAAEEDKRRRNTAASARFRVKKKQREQALEKQAKELSDKVQMLEGKVQQLEMENKWLKGLITEKGKEGGAANLAEVVNKAAQQEEGEQSTEQRADGVGTSQDLKAEA